MSSTILSLVPAPGGPIDWPAIANAFPQWEQLAACPQDPFYHAEGDVWTHTKMVCEELVLLEAYAKSNRERQVVLFGAALYHDVAKPACTRMIDGRVTSRGHSRAGAIDARVALWRSEMPFELRERIARIVQYHQEPFYVITKDNARFVLHKLSHELNLEELSIVAEADARGRRTVPESDRQATLDNIELFRTFATEEGCYRQPKPMADEHTRIRYFRTEGRVSCDYPAFAEPGSEVIVLAGLPATGKNTYCALNFPDLPVISFDDAREELGFQHGDRKAGKATHLAVDRAKELLRARLPFVWNATHVSRLARAKTLDLLYAYNAHVTIVYLEQPEHVVMARNSKRDTSLRNKDIEQLYWKWEVPLPTEAHRVSYQTA